MIEAPPASASSISQLTGGRIVSWKEMFTAILTFGIFAGLFLLAGSLFPVGTWFHQINLHLLEQDLQMRKLDESVSNNHRIMQAVESHMRIQDEQIQHIRDDLRKMHPQEKGDDVSNEQGFP
jgi:hypothetical protein